jgi:hypothetical protein
MRWWVRSQLALQVLAPEFRPAGGKRQASPRPAAWRSIESLPDIASAAHAGAAPAHSIAMTLFNSYHTSARESCRASCTRKFSQRLCAKPVRNLRPDFSKTVNFR